MRNSIRVSGAVQQVVTIRMAKSYMNGSKPRKPTDCLFDNTNRKGTRGGGLSNFGVPKNKSRTYQLPTLVGEDSHRVGVPVQMSTKSSNKLGIKTREGGGWVGKERCEKKQLTHSAGWRGGRGTSACGKSDASARWNNL